MNKSHISLSILLFTSLYSPTILGMELKNKQEIFTLYKHKDNLNAKNGDIHTLCKRANQDIHTLYQQNTTLSNTFPFALLPNETISHLVNNELANSKKNIKILRLVCFDFAQHYAKDQSTWSFMPNDIEKAYDVLFSPHKKHPYNKEAKSNLILAYFAEQNNCKAMQWIIKNINPPCKVFSQEADPILFTHKNKLWEMHEIVIKLHMKNVYSEEYIINNWKSYSNEYFYNNMENFLPSNRHNSFFPSYCLATQFDNVDRLNELCSQTKPTSMGMHYLLCHSKNNGPKCFIYLFDQYKNETMIEAWNDDFLNHGCCEVVKNYLKQQQPSSCTIQ